MYVCMHIYTYVCMYVCMYVLMYDYIYVLFVRKYISMFYVCMYIFTHACMHARMCVIHFIKLKYNSDKDRSLSDSTSPIPELRHTLYKTTTTTSHVSAPRSPCQRRRRHHVLFKMKTCSSVFSKRAR